MNKKRYSILLFLPFLLTGCNQTKEIKETTLSKEEIEKQNIIFDVNGNTGIYIKEEIEDVIPETIIPIEDRTSKKDKEVLETLPETQETIEEIQETIEETITVVSDVNVRELPNSENSNVLGVLTVGTTLNKLGIENGWIKIEYNNGIGYIYQDFVQ